MQFDIKLQQAIEAIAIPDFKHEDLLSIALTDPSDLNHPAISRFDREHQESIYRRLAFLGDALIDSVLADYLFNVNSRLTQKALDGWRQKVASKASLTEFAIELGLPEFSSSWNKESRKPPKDEPRLWGEMFEAVVAVIFLEYDRDFMKLCRWLDDRFIRNAIGAYVGDPSCKSTAPNADAYLDAIGLEKSQDSVRIPEKND